MPIRDLLVGPTEQEVLNNLINNAITPNGLRNLIKNYAETAYNLFSQGLNQISQTNKDIAFNESINQGNIDIVKLLIDDPLYSANISDEAVICAAYHGYIDIKNSLLRNRNDITATNEAEIYEHFRSSQVLIESLGRLMNTCTNEQVIEKANEFNLWHGISTNRKEDIFIEAVENGNSDLVSQLLDLGLNVRSNSNKAIKQSAYHGQIEMIKLLIDRGADLHAGNEMALINAATRRTDQFETVQLLVERGARVSEVDWRNDWKNVRQRNKTYLLANGAHIGIN